MKRDTHEDARIAPCPYCGGRGYWSDMVIAKGVSRNGALPEDAALTEAKRNPATGRESLFWERHGYAIHCSTPRCKGRTAHWGYRTLERAIAWWNNAAEESEGCEEEERQWTETTA